MTNTTNEKDLLNDLFFNEDDEFLLNLASTINDFQKEDFDWFNNLHLNYTPTSTTTTTAAETIDNTQLSNEIPQISLETPPPPTTTTTETSVDDTLTVILSTNELTLNDTTPPLPPQQIITQPSPLLLQLSTSETTEWAKPTTPPPQPAENPNKKKLQNTDKCLKCKEKIIKNLNKFNIKKNIKSTIKSSSSSSSSSNSAVPVVQATATTTTTTPLNTILYNSTPSVNLIDKKLTKEINKKYLLNKRTRKRSKPIVITPSVSFNNSSQTIINPSLLLSNCDFTTEINKKSSSELEPLNKKFAVGNNDNNSSSSSSSIFGNKKNVDFHIEQFSQLDLHSSEEDSELYIRNFNRKFKKPINSPNFNFNSECNQNEITKRTRYSSSDADTRMILNENSSNSNNGNNNIIVQTQEQQQPQPLRNDIIKVSSLSNLQIDSQNDKITNSLTITPKLVTQTPKTSQKDIDKLIELLKGSSSLSSSASSSSSSSYTCNNNNNNNLPTVTTSDTNNSSNESNDLIINKNTKRKKIVQNRSNKITTININSNSNNNAEEFTLNDFKSLDLNSDHDELSNFLIDTNSQMTNISTSTTTTNSRDERHKLWNLLKSNTNYNEIITELGSIIASKMSFWDLAKLKLKYSNSKLTTTTDIINDYTLLYSNMSKLLEHVVHQHSTTQNRSDNSSRSRSSSRNFRKTTK